MLLTCISLYVLPIFGLLWSSCCCTTPSVTCGACSSGTAPGQFKIVIAGIVSDSCNDCESLNGTYYLNNTTATSTLCIWRLNDVPVEFCDDANVQTISIELDFAVLFGAASITAQINVVDGGFNFYQATWQESLGGLADCNSYTDHSIPLLSQDTSLFPDHCDGPSATFEITTV